MNKQRSQRMRPVIRLAENDEEQAALLLGEQRELFDRQRRQLRELESYRTEYRRHAAQTGDGGITAARLAGLRQFLLTLDRAIDQQSVAVKMAEQLCERRQSDWFAARNRTQTLLKVKERYRRDEVHAEERREQRVLDEFAQRPRPNGF